MSTYSLAEIRNGAGWGKDVRFVAVSTDDGQGEYRPAYNGWPNRETWNLSLWINNEESLYLTARAIVAEAGVNDHGIGEDRRSRMQDAASALKEWIAETYDESDNGVPNAGPVRDAWQYALDVADWYRIAEGLAE